MEHITDIASPQPVEPSEEVAQDIITQTPPQEVAEENNNSDTATENVTDNNIEEQASEDQVKDVSQIEAKLREYEIKEQEAINLRNKLGLNDENTETIHLDTIEATLDNKAQQRWIRLCNSYGVDSTPQGLEKSMNELLEKDPKAYYEFKHQGERLYNELEVQKQSIHQARVDRELGMFVEANKPIIENSPAVQSIVENYIRTNYNSLSNPAQQLGGLMDAIKMIYAEAVEVGKQVGKIETVTNDKSSVSSNNSIATANTSSYSMSNGDKIFTRAEISKMDTATFDKYEKIIRKQMMEGLIK